MPIFSFRRRESKPKYKTGHGEDDHRITEEEITENGKRKPLIVAGKIVSDKLSPIAHSDGDVVYHALVNALLLGVGKRDIGFYFPDNDPANSNKDSISFVKFAMDVVRSEGYEVNNATVMITAKRPKMSPHVGDMTSNLATLLGVNTGCVGIGATTGEGLSDQGRGGGIHASVVVLLRRY